MRSILLGLAVWQEPGSLQEPPGEPREQSLSQAAAACTQSYMLGPPIGSWCWCYQLVAPPHAAPRAAGLIRTDKRNQAVIGFISAPGGNKVHKLTAQSVRFLSYSTLLIEIAYTGRLDLCAFASFSLANIGRVSCGHQDCPTTVWRRL